MMGKSILSYLRFYFLLIVLSPLFSKVIFFSFSFPHFTFFSPSYLSPFFFASFSLLLVPAFICHLSFAPAASSLFHGAASRLLHPQGAFQTFPVKRNNKRALFLLSKELSKGKIICLSEFPFTPHLRGNDVVFFPKRF